ncbi:MAG: hypothetical protein KO202_05840 [Methanobacteriaceae archaeon]|jgi:hypothetical protein|nr:hypothetical protein [Methanobacteriaceae archaeon]
MNVVDVYNFLKKEEEKNKGYKITYFKIIGNDSNTEFVLESNTDLNEQVISLCVKQKRQSWPNLKLFFSKSNMCFNTLCVLLADEVLGANDIDISKLLIDYTKENLRISYYYIDGTREIGVIKSKKDEDGMFV